MGSGFGNIRQDRWDSRTDREVTKALKDRQFERITRALAQPRRVHILRELATRKSPVPYTTLLKTHRISAANLSHRVKELETAGLVVIVREGKFGSVTLQHDVIRNYLDSLSRLIDQEC